MIQTKKDLKFYIQEDAKRNHITSKWNYIVGLVSGAESCCVFHYLRTMRYSEYYLNNKNKNAYCELRYRYSAFKLSRLGLKYGLRIGLNMVGYGLRISHIAGGVIINCKSMGNYCSVNSGVVVGKKDSNDQRAIIGDRVGLTVGSKVIGKVTIGNKVLVAPNSVVIKDIPEKCVVSGVPATIIKRR